MERAVLRADASEQTNQASWPANMAECLAFIRQDRPVPDEPKRGLRLPKILPYDLYEPKVKPISPKVGKIDVAWLVIVILLRLAGYYWVVQIDWMFQWYIAILMEFVLAVALRYFSVDWGNPVWLLILMDFVDVFLIDGRVKGNFGLGPGLVRLVVSMSLTSFCLGCCFLPISMWLSRWVPDIILVLSGFMVAFRVSPAIAVVISVFLAVRAPSRSSKGILLLAAVLSLVSLIMVSWPRIAGLFERRPTFAELWENAFLLFWLGRGFCSLFELFSRNRRGALWAGFALVLGCCDSLFSGLVGLLGLRLFMALAEKPSHLKLECFIISLPVYLGGLITPLTCLAG